MWWLTGWLCFNPRGDEAGWIRAPPLRLSPYPRNALPAGATHEPEDASKFLLQGYLPVGMGGSRKRGVGEGLRWLLRRVRASAPV